MRTETFGQRKYTRSIFYEVNLRFLTGDPTRNRNIHTITDPDHTHIQNATTLREQLNLISDGPDKHV